MAGFTIEDLTFAYPESKEDALSHINLNVNDGEILLICGTSGCGKSTLLRHLKTCLTPHGKRSGRVLFDGKELSEVPSREQAARIGYVLQHPDDQIVTDKVWHELAFALESLGTKQGEMRLKIGEMASYFGIQNWFYKNVTELSGGQKQLLNLAAVMTLNPDVIILDEPTSQLDPIAASEFLATLRKLNRELGITVVLSEHRLEEAFPMADSVLVLEGGKIIAHDSAEKVASILDMSSDIYHALPTAAKIYRELELAGECPLTVKDGRDMLKKLDLKPEALTENEKENTQNAKDKVPALELSECYMRYEREGDDILKGLSFKAYSGEIYSIVGGNGTGKSTALSVIAGVNRQYRGKVIIGGRMRKANETANGIGALPQDPRMLFVQSTVEKDLLEMLGNIKDKEAKKLELDRVVKLMDIEDLLSSHPYDLSGGEQQRVAIAKVLLMKPSILLLDEPTKGMDAHFKEKFGALLRTMADDGICIIMVSHDVEFCARYSSRCALFFDGSIISENDPREFFSGNHFYTTSTNRMARFVFKNAVLCEEVTELCKKQIK